MSTRRRLLAAGCAAAVAVTGAAGATAVASPAEAADPTAVQQINLVSDQPGNAAITDPNLVNAWGMAHGPNSPIWVSDNGTGVSTLYRGAVGSTPVSTVPLVVRVPGGAPTGQVYNDTTGFLVRGTAFPALFIFADEGGRISAWSPAARLHTAISVAHVDGGVLKGLALVHSPFGPLLLAADFASGQVDVFDSSFRRLGVKDLFRDRRLPAGYAPFNIAEIGNKVFVTYAEQDAEHHDDVAGPGHGFIDEFTNYGTLVRRFASRGPLNSPWGLAVAPSSFGTLAGTLLVGNFGDGRIHAFDLNTGDLVGTVQNAQHGDLVIYGLWGLTVGDDAAGGSDSVWFSAGPDGEAHGLLGLLRAA